MILTNVRDKPNSLAVKGVLGAGGGAFSWKAFLKLITKFILNL
jgi:hypothetical protein